MISGPKNRGRKRGTMMWTKYNNGGKELMADVSMKKISVSRLVCVRTMYRVKIAVCVALIAGAMLTACGVQDKALVLIGEETVNNQVGAEEDFGSLAVGKEALAEPVVVVSGVATENGSGAQEKGASTIVVFVCGAVQNPGVVELPEGSRAADALDAVGGLLADAQTDYVNLAVKLEDAQKLYFPTVEEAEILTEEARENAGGLVNINTADKNRLCTLPGIGETRAEAIIAYREKNGDFRSKEDIMKVSGIKQNAYDKLRDHITIE